MNDSLLLTAAGIFIAILALVLEIAARRKIIPFWLCRKLLHITAIGICGGIVLVLNRIEMLRWIVAIACLLLFILVSLGVFFKEENGRRSWGIALFPLPFLALLCMHDAERGLIALPMLSLAFCDAAAAIVGTLWGRHIFYWNKDPKSREGSVAFWICASILLSWPYFSPIDGLESLHVNNNYLLSLPLLALFSTLAEALGSRGNDNVWIPLTVWAGLLCMEVAQPDWVVIVGVSLSIPFFYLIISRLKWLNQAGIAGAIILGGLVMLSQGWRALVLPIFFLLSSTLLGKFRKGSSQREAKAGKPRDAIQVMANGGIFLILCCLTLVWPQTELLVALALSMSVSTADTWASEVGAWLGKRTLDIRTFQQIEKGLSGGISIAGTLAAIVGSSAIAVISAIFFVELRNTSLVLIITIGGFAGMLLDSILGSRLQARYTNINGQHSDVPLEGFRLSRGWPWLNNDAVNLLSNATIIALFIICMLSQSIKLQ